MNIQQKTTLPWSHVSIYCKTNVETKVNTPSPCQSSHICVCTWWKQRLSARWRAEELQLRLYKTRHPHSTCCLTRKHRVQDDLMMRQKGQKGQKVESLVLHLNVVWCCSGCEHQGKHSNNALWPYFFFSVPERKQEEEGELRPVHVSVSRNGIKPRREKGG